MALTTTDFAQVAKVTGITTAGVFAGYVWGLSRAGVRSVVYYGAQDDTATLPKWRFLFVDGSNMARPSTTLNLLSFGYLAYKAPNTLLRTLFTVAAVLGASGTPYALTFLRRTNGALSRRTLRLDGPFEQHVAGSATEKTPVDPQPVPLTYATDEAASIARENDPEWTTQRLLERWAWHNNVRTGILMIGVVTGAVAVVLSG